MDGIIEMDKTYVGGKLRKEQPWNFDRPPVFNQTEWHWRYYIATESVDGDEILIIIAVDTLNRSFEVITRWRE